MWVQIIETHHKGTQSARNIVVRCRITKCIIAEAINEEAIQGAAHVILGHDLSCKVQRSPCIESVVSMDGPSPTMGIQHICFLLPLQKCYSGLIPISEGSHADENIALDKS